MMLDPREQSLPGTQPAPASSIIPAKPKLSRRDYFMVPVLIVATAAMMFAGAEIGSRMIWPAHEDYKTCVREDKSGTLHSVPNCSVSTKIAEGPWVTYKYNECGYRTNDSCGIKPAGVLRIAFIGASITQGYHVPLNETFPERTARAIANATGRTVQDENLGFEGLSPLQVYRRVSEVIALHPDLVVYAVSPFDLEEQLDPDQLAARNHPEITFDRPAATIHLSFLKWVAINIQDSRAIIMAQHFLFTNTDTYLRLSLSRGDKTDYMREPLSPPWQKRFADFNLILTDMANRFHAAGIPMLIMAVPSHQIAALLSSEHHAPNSDAFEFGDNIEKLAKPLGIGYVDATKAFSQVPHSDRLFYLFESHLTGEGNAVVAKALIHKCLDGSVPAFRQTLTPVAGDQLVSKR
jgi:hypothetical protein